MRIYRRAFWKAERQLVELSTFSHSVQFQIPFKRQRWLRPLLGKGDVLFKPDAERLALRDLEDERPGALLDEALVPLWAVEAQEVDGAD